VSYTATGGTISAGGLYTAGGTIGSFRVIATVQSGTLADSSTVTISGSSGGAVDTVFYEGFESGSLAPWTDEGSPQNHQIVTPAGGPVAGTKALQITYPANSDGGWLTHFFMPGYDSVYVRYYIKLESGWQGGTKLSSLYGSRTDNQWSAAGKSGVCPDGTDFFVATLTGDPSPQMKLRFYAYYPGMPRESDGVTCYGSNGGAGTTYTPDPFTLSSGVWHKVEHWVRLNTPANADGYQEFRIDDVVRGAWPSLRLRTSTILRLNSFTISANSVYATQTQHLWIDEVLVTRQRPGT
jgi:hypothetical protein